MMSFYLKLIENFSLNHFFSNKETKLSTINIIEYFIYIFVKIQLFFLLKMNFTVLSLVSTSTISLSPIYVGNNISSIKSNYQKFFTSIFFNQRSFLIKGTKFRFGLCGVIRKDHSMQTNYIDDPKLGKYQQTIYESEKISITTNFQKSTAKASFSIIDCTFQNINYNEYIIKISSDTSFYLTDTTFCHSSGNKNPIWLDSNRCNTITHVCSSDVIANDAGGGASFIFSNAKRTDFFILVYSTLVGIINDKQKAHTVYCNYGQHYHRCNNYTNQEEKNGALGMDAVVCFSCGMMTMNNIKGPLFKISGVLSEFSTKTDRKHIIFDMLSVNNLNSHGDYNGLIRLEIKDGPSFDTHFNDCVFTNVNIYNPYLFSIGETGSVEILIILNNCQIDSRFKLINQGNNNNAKIDDGSVYSLVAASEIKTLHLVHYTNQVCIGPENVDNKEIARGCHVDKCYEGSNCNNTIGFPEDAAPYNTRFYPDIQTPTPTPTGEFSNSNTFTKSSQFTRSNGFTSSGHFTSSQTYSPSAKFTDSASFSKSNSFSKSKEFSGSAPFSGSRSFTPSVKFTDSASFTKSNSFTKSKEFSGSASFTGSRSFTPSAKFTESASFTKSNTFTESNKFTSSHAFSGSRSFTPSARFTSSLTFSKSDAFSESLIFPHYHPPETTPPQSLTASRSPSQSPSASVSPSCSATASSFPSQTEKQSELPAETIAQSSTPTLSINDDLSEFCPPEESTGDLKSLKCRIRLYIIYLLLALIAVLTIATIVLSALLCKSPRRVENYSNDQDNNEAEQYSSTQTTNNDPFHVDNE